MRLQFAKPTAENCQSLTTRGNGISRMYEIIVKNDTAEILITNCHDQYDSAHFWRCMIFLDGSNKKLEHISVPKLPEWQYIKKGNNVTVERS
jgi:hypothetical protein